MTSYYIDVSNSVASHSPWDCQRTFGDLSARPGRRWSTMKLDHDQMWTLIGEILWDILVLLDEKALLELGTCTRYLLVQCERRRLQVFLHQVKSPEKRSAGKLRLSDDGHVSRKLCPPPKRLLRVQNTRSVQGALMKLSRVVKDEDQLVISSILPWVECGDQSTRACALRAVGRVCRFGHREAVSALMRCIRESSLNAAAMLELGNTLQRLVPSNDPDILKEIYQLMESNAFPVRHAALQVFGGSRRGTYGTQLSLVTRPVGADAAPFCVAGVALGDTELRFVWQAWHLVTWTFTLCGRRGTYGTQLSLVTRPVGADAASFCVAAWHLVTRSFVLCGRRGTWRHVLLYFHGRRGTYGAQLSLVTRPVGAAAGVALGDMDGPSLCVAGVALTALS
eukprot:s3746_g6.t1